MRGSLRAEPADQGWAKSTEVAAKRAVDQELHDVARVRTVKCRTSLCELIVDHEDEVARQRFLGDFHWRVPFNFGAFIHPTTDSSGALVTEVFFLREGAEPFRWAELD